MIHNFVFTRVCFIDLKGRVDNVGILVSNGNPVVGVPHCATCVVSESVPVESLVVDVFHVVGCRQVGGHLFTDQGLCWLQDGRSGGASVTGRQRPGPDRYVVAELVYYRICPIITILLHYCPIITILLHYAPLLLYYCIMPHYYHITGVPDLHTTLKVDVDFSKKSIF